MPGGGKTPDEVTTINAPWPGMVPYLTGGTHYNPNQQPGTIGGQPGSFTGSVGGQAGFPGTGTGFSLYGGGYPGGFNPFGGMPGGSAGGGPVGLFPEASNIYRNAPSMVGPFNPTQLQSQDQALDYANNFGGLFQPYMESLQGMATGSGMNPYLDEAIAAATRPIREQLREDILPAIDRSATGSGNVGSSRAGIAEGLASGRSQDAVGDVSRRMAFDAFGKNLDQQARAMALYPQMLQAGQIPFNITGQVGDLQYKQAQQERLEPFSRYDWYSNPIMGSLGGGYGARTEPIDQGSGFLETVGNVASTGAEIAALIGMFSDPQLKRDVSLIGNNGLNIYEWTWNEEANRLGLFGRDRGYMATEVPAEFVGERNGYLTVNYAALGGKP